MDQYKKIAHGIHGQSKRSIQKVYTYFYSMIDDFLIFVLVILKSGEYSGMNLFNESIIEVLVIFHYLQLQSIFPVMPFSEFHKPVYSHRFLFQDIFDIHQKLEYHPIVIK